jgi:uncharacterized membrane protein
MKTRIVITGAIAAAMTAAIASAPIAAAEPNPLVPYGTNPQPSTHYGLHEDNHDEVDTTNGLIDLPF